MAREFWLSEQTIKYHLTNIYRKLGVSSRTEAVRQAYENRVIENPVLRSEAITACARPRSDRRTKGHGDVAVSLGPRSEEEAELAQRLIRVAGPPVDDAARVQADGPHREAGGPELDQEARQQPRRIHFDHHIHCHRDNLAHADWFGPARRSVMWSPGRWFDPPACVRTRRLRNEAAVPAPIPGARRGEPCAMSDRRDDQRRHELRSGRFRCSRDRLVGGSDGGCGACGRDRFEARVDAESPKETAHVVLDRLGAQVELGSDLLRRAAVLEQTEYLDLPR